MKDNLKIIRNPGAGRLFWAWVFLLLIPTFVFDLSIRQLFQVTEKSNQLLLKEDLINEINQFEKDVKVTEFLDRSFKNLKKQYSGLAESKNARGIAERIFKMSGFRTAGIIVHGKNCDTIEDVYLDTFMKEKLGRISQSFSQRLFRFINQKQISSRSQIKSHNEARSTIDEIDFLRLKNVSEGFFQRQYGLIANTNIVPERIIESVSARLGGFVYFYYQPFFDDESEEIPSSGFLAIIRGCDIRPVQIVQSALKLSQNDLKRSIVPKAIPPVSGAKIFLEPLTRFYSDQTGLHLEIPVPQNFIAHSIGAGTFYPGNFQKVAENLPTLKVTAPEKLYQHWLHKHYSQIRILEQLLVFIGAIMALHFFFFGFEVKARLASKAIIGIIVTSALPLSLLFVSFGTYFEVSEKSRLIETNNFLKHKIEKVATRFNNFISGLHLSAFKLSQEIEGILASDPAKLSKHLESELGQLHVQEAFFEAPKQKTVYIRNKNLPYFPLSKEESNLREIVTRTILDSLRCIAEYNSEVFIENGKDLFKDVFFVDPNFLNNNILGKGRLVEMDQIKSFNSFSSNLLIDLKSRKHLGFLTFRFHQPQLVEIFLKQELSRIEDSSLCFYGFETRSIDDHIFSYRGKLDENMKTNIIRAKESGSHYFWWQKDPEPTGNCIMVLPRYPLIIHARQKVGGNMSFKLIVFGGIMYFLILLNQAFAFFARAFLNPITSLSLAAKEAGQGNFKVVLDFEAEGEFLKMKNAFSEMQRGMLQKEKLSEFVSTEVLNQIDSSGSNEEGEKIEATVVFATIRKFNEWIKSSDKSKAVQALQISVEAADNLAEQTGGSLDKVIGDTLMVVFRGRNADHAAKASEFSLKLKENLSLHNIEASLGMATGKVISGCIGDANGKLDMTVIGDTVNLAARLKGIALKKAEPMIIIAPSTIRALKGLGKLKFIEKLAIKGKSREFPIYQLISLRN